MITVKSPAGPAFSLSGFVWRQASRLQSVVLTSQYVRFHLCFSSQKPVSPMYSILRTLLLLALCCSPLAYAADAPPAKLKYGTWGFDLSGMDTKTKAGDDFFRFANGAWLDKTQLPPDKPAYSLPIIMTYLSEPRTKDLL